MASSKTLNPRNQFLTANSTPAVAGKKQTPMAIPAGNKPYSTISDKIVPPTPAKPNFGQPSATSMSQPKQQYINSMASSTGTSAGPSAGASTRTDLSSLLPGLQKLKDSLGTYGKATEASTPSASPKTDYYDKTRSAMDAYIKSLQPSEEEGRLQSQLDNLQSATRSGVSRQAEEAIPMNFITGRQQAIENRGLAMTDPLERELARLSGDRTALSAGQKARYDFEKELAGEQKADDRYAEGNFQTIGNDVVRLRPDGTSEVVYQGTPDVKTEVVQAGGRNVLINSKTGEIISNLGATEGALSRADSGSSGYGSGSSELSAAAQNIIKQINLGGDINELIKGNSIEAQRLRNEVFAGMNAQGGYANKDNLIISEGKTLVDEMINNKAYKALGGYSTKLGGQFGTAYGDAQRQAQQLTSILSRDNLGLLKGAMSDADLAFIKSMSSGFEGEGIPSETYIKNRLETIQTKLDKRLSGTSMGGGSSLPQTRTVNGVTYTLQPDGTYE